MIAAWGLKRIEDMSRDDLILALNEMHERYMMLIRARMYSNEVPVFHEDMDKWNERLERWFVQEPKGTIDGENEQGDRSEQAASAGDC